MHAILPIYERRQNEILQDGNVLACTSLVWYDLGSSSADSGIDLGTVRSHTAGLGVR